MSLDLVILDDDGFPESKVGLDANIHARLIRHALRHESKVLLSIENYYEDAVFSERELAKLVNELELLRAADGADEQLRRVIDDIASIARLARARTKNLEALAD
ncbi:MAG: hypothetical protein AAF715_30670 [Myxococcota bacterium]